MENRDKRLVQFGDNFCVHLYFVQGEMLRIYVEIFTCLDSIKENEKKSDSQNWGRNEGLWRSDLSQLSSHPPAQHFLFLCAISDGWAVTQNSQDCIIVKGLWPAFQGLERFYICWNCGRKVASTSDAVAEVLH